MALYTVKGNVDNTQEKFYVELVDDDQKWFEDKVDDLLGSSWTDHGNFEISFDDSFFKKDELEFRPELFIIIRNKTGKIVYTSQKKNPSNASDTQNLLFPNLLTKSDIEINHDPYSSNNARRISAFGRIGDGIDVSVEDITNTSTLLLQSLNAWLLYNNESVSRSVGYDGPQVPKYPRKESHDHKLDWEQ
jgi:hypothetical protein